MKNTITYYYPTCFKDFKAYAAPNIVLLVSEIG